MRAIQIDRFGGPEVLAVREVPTPEPQDGEVLVRVSRAGINFADTHQRENSYIARYDLPLIPGGEVAGVVERGPAGLEPGQRVIALVGTGAYAEYAVAPAANVFPIPDGVDDGQALALLIQGLTAWHLYRTCARVAPGESVVVVSGAGGVGSLALQLGRWAGAGRLIATASSERKRELCLELGADAAVDAAAEDLTAELVAANDGRPVDAVFEMAGGRVFDACLAALAPFGRIVAYGIAGREQNELRTGSLMRRSRSVIGFWLMHCLGRRDMVEQPLRELFELAARGELNAIVGGTYPLADAARAHEDLQSRATTGKLLLDPTA